MVINVNSATGVQTQNDISSNQDMQRTNVQAAQNYGQTTNTTSSTHNLYSPKNLLNDKLLDPVVTQQIIKNARLDRLDNGKTLGDRFLSLFSTNSNTNNPPPIDEQHLEDMYSKLMRLGSQGHLKSLVRSFNRRAGRGETTDQAYGSHNIKDEHADLSEKEKVKRKEGQTINENSINDVIKEGLRQHDTPFQRFLFLSMCVKNPSGNYKFDKAVQEELNNLYKNHGLQIRANSHSLDESLVYGKYGKTPQEIRQRITQFNDAYYQLIQAQSNVQMFSIFKECASIQEFTNITNLMHTSAEKDKDGVTLPTSDPNTIHNVLSFMDRRTTIISLIKSADKFYEACRMAFSAIINKSAKQTINTTIKKQIDDSLAAHNYFNKTL